MGESNSAVNSRVLYENFSLAGWLALAEIDTAHQGIKQWLGWGLFWSSEPSVSLCHPLQLKGFCYFGDGSAPFFCLSVSFALPLNCVVAGRFVAVTWSAESSTCVEKGTTGSFEVARWFNSCIQTFRSSSTSVMRTPWPCMTRQRWEVRHKTLRYSSRDPRYPYANHWFR